MLDVKIKTGHTSGHTLNQDPSENPPQDPTPEDPLTPLPQDPTPKYSKTSQ